MQDFPTPATTPNIIPIVVGVYTGWPSLPITILSQKNFVALPATSDCSRSSFSLRTSRTMEHFLKVLSCPLQRPNTYPPAHAGGFCHACRCQEAFFGTSPAASSAWRPDASPTAIRMLHRARRGRGEIQLGIESVWFSDKDMILVCVFQCSRKRLLLYFAC